MKNTIKFLRIIALVAIIGLCFIACDDGGNGNIGGNQTPVVSDYNIDNLIQAPGVITAVTITAKNDSSPGAISNIRYAGNAAVPQTAGIYAVYFDVAAATGWNAAPDIFAGNLMVGIPVADDYYIGNLNQSVRGVTAVTITAKSGKSPGSVTKRYNGSTTVPQTEGTYAVTFDVAAASDWNAATGLSAGNLVVSKGTPVASDYNFGNLDQKTGNVIAVTITPKSGVSPGSVTNIRYGGNTVIPQTEGVYFVTFDVEAATGWNTGTNLYAVFVISDYPIGSTGPGGGIVFYNQGDYSDGWRYLEAASVSQELNNLAWASSGFTSRDIAGTETTIGTGKANTAAILAVDANAPAAKACIDYRGGGYTDWFLPSLVELDAMHNVKTILGMLGGFFWSSSQRDNSSAWNQHFMYGSQGAYHKDGSPYGGFSVRAVRAF